ncbi:MAG: hypothetical protein WBP89_14465, partial [Sedimenticolaceae bacterium]
RRCNQRKEKNEEFFLATFMFSDAAETKVGQALWVDKMNRVYFRGRGVGGAIRKRMRPLNLVTPSGIYAGKGIGVEIVLVQRESEFSGSRLRDNFTAGHGLLPRL